MCRGREGRAGQRSAAGQRSRGAPRQGLMFVWSFGGSLILTQRSAHHRAQSRSTLEGQRDKIKHWTRKPSITSSNLVSELEIVISTGWLWLTNCMTQQRLQERWGWIDFPATELVCLLMLWIRWIRWIYGSPEGQMRKMYSVFLVVLEKLIVNNIIIIKSNSIIL